MTADSRGRSVGWRSKVSESCIRFQKAATVCAILASLTSGVGAPSSAAPALSSIKALKQLERGISGHDRDGEFFSCGVDHAKTSTGQLMALEAETARAKDASWTLGQKRLLFIRVDFSDLPGTPFSDATGTSLISNLNAFYTDMSYGQAGFALQGAGSEVTPTLRLPQAAAWYGTNNFYNPLRTDARNAAAVAGYSLTDFDLDVICFGPVPGFNWNGLANVGAAGAWLRGNFSVGVAAHELGHNFGLNHANFWDTAGQSVIGPGTSVEYGDGFDTMGDGRRFDSRYHFNACYKSHLDWLTTNDVRSVTTSGTFRIYAQDEPLATGLRALKIAVEVPPPFPLPIPGPFNYWVEFRQQITENKWLLDGAGLRWGWNGIQTSLLLDTTPGSTDGKNDSALVIGRTFSDANTGIHITPIGKGGTSPESLDVVINLGNFPSNLPPTLTVTANASNTEPGVPLNFEAAASDPNGDSLAYYWDFGDGNYGTNGPAASHTWSSAGNYIVRCRVTDMHGGNAGRSVVITVGAPATYRISGRVTEGGQPLENVRIFASSTQMSYTDSDGNYALAGLPPGNYTINASLDGHSFSTSGFSNPVSVAPDAFNIDFLASTISYPPYIITQPSSRVVQAGTDVAFNLVAGGTPPLSYLWRLNGSIIEGATDKTYTRTNVQSFDQGSYTVIASNVAGMVTSAVATLVLRAPPTIISQPASQIVNLGSNATFSVVVAGGGGASLPLRYQWFFNSTNLIYGATSNTFKIIGVQDSDAGYYSVEVDNGAKTNSSNALLIVNHLPVAGSDTLYRPPTNSVQVAIETLLSNDSDADGDLLTFLSFSTNSAHGGTLSLDNGSLTYLPSPGFTNVDEFTYIIGDGRGGTATGTVTVAIDGVSPPPTIISQPASQIVNIDSNATFSVIVAGGGGPGSLLRYQWFFNSTNLIAGATNDTLAIIGVRDSDAGYYSVEVDNGVRTTSSNALLTVNHLPVAGADTLYRQPTNFVQVAIETLLSNDSDADGDLLTFLSFSTNSAHGGTLSLDNGSLTYLPPPGFTNADEFTYTISDGRGGTATGTATVTIVPQPTLTITRLGNGSYLIRLKGVPGQIYRLEYTDGLEHPIWQPLTSGTANESGILEWTDSPPADSGSRFYRAVHP